MAIRYGLTGNWSSTSTWSTSSGGASGASVPTAADDVILDSNSGAITIDAGAVCRSLDCTSGTGNYAGTLTHTAAVALTIGDATAGAGNVALKLSAGMTYTLGNAASSSISFVSTSATQQTITTAGKLLGSTTYNAASNGSWIFSDSFATGVSAPGITLTQGSLNTGNQTINVGFINISGSLTRSLTLGSSAITLTNGGGNPWSAATITNLTFNAGTSTITLSGSSTGFAGGGLTYNNVVCSGGALVSLTGSNTFANFTRTGTATKTDSLSITGNQTITNTLTLNGNSITNRLLVLSTTAGTAVTLTSAVNSMSNVDFADITAAGAANWNLSAISGGAGDAGGNTGITFTPGLTLYWQTLTTGTKTMSTAANYFLATNGGGGAGRVPLPQDDVIFDANSIGATGTTIQTDQPRIGRSIDFTGVTNSPTFSNSAATTFYGSLTMVAGMTLSGALGFTFAGRSTYTITSAGNTFTQQVTFAAPGGVYTPQDAYASSGGLVITAGTFNGTTFNVTASVFSSTGSLARTITMGSGIWSFTANGTTVFNTSPATNLTLNRGNPVRLTYAGATGTRTITGGGVENQAFDISIVAGTDIIALANGIERDVDFTGFSGTWTNAAGNGSFIYGSLTVSATTTITAGTGSTTFKSTSGTKTITTNGVMLDFPVTFDGVGGTWALNDNFANGSTRTLVLTNGIVDFNDKNVTSGAFGSTNTNARTLFMRSGTLTLTGTGTVWNTATSTNFTLVAGSSTIKVTDTSNTANSFSGGNLTYNNLWWSRGASTASNTMVGNNTFANLRDNGSAAHSLLFTAGSTTNIGSWSVSGTPGNLITLNSTTTAIFNLVSVGGIMSGDYLDIQHSVARPWSGAAGSDSWFAGTHSNDNQAVATAGSGWIFTDAPAQGGSATAFGKGRMALKMGLSIS